MSVAGVAIVSVGNELLFGQTTDTNASWLGRRLTALGLPVVARWTVGDVEADIQGAVRAALAMAEVVLVSGGLGPTRDDVTREAVARLLERPLRLDPVVREAIDRRFRAAGHEGIPAVSLAVAHVPDGALVLANEHGTAPGLVLETEGRAVVMLPGVPRELRGLFESGVEPYLEQHYTAGRDGVVHRVVHTTGIPESHVAERLAPVLEGVSGAVSVAFLPDIRGVDVRLTAAAGAQEALRAAVAAVDESLAPWAFDAPSTGDLAEAVVSALRAQGCTLGTAESCTGGLIGRRVTEIAGASDVFVGGIIAYANGVKTGLLGVSAEALDRDGAVSESVARAMAEGARRILGTDVAVSVTGVAGPGGGSPEKPIGTVWMGVSGPSGVNARLAHFVGDRWEVRERAAQAALAMVLGAVRDPMAEG